MILSFIEGLAVLTVELLSAKLIAPILGTTIYVWTAIISITLGGLAIGYFVGSRLAQKTERIKLLTGAFLIGAILTALLPVTVTYTAPLVVHLSLRFQPLLVAIAAILPIMVVLGSVGPVLIEIGSTQSTGVGSIAGNVFALSTAGGIFSIVVLTYWAMPQVGIRQSLLAVSFLLFLVAFLVYFFLQSTVNELNSKRQH